MILCITKLAGSVCLPSIYFFDRHLVVCQDCLVRCIQVHILTWIVILLLIWVICILVFFDNKAEVCEAITRGSSSVLNRLMYARFQVERRIDLSVLSFLSNIRLIN